MLVASAQLLRRLTKGRRIRTIGMREMGIRDMKGSEDARQRRAAPSEDPTALIAVSGFGPTQHVRNSQKTSFTRYLVKPVESIHYSPSSRASHKDPALLHGAGLSLPATSLAMLPYQSGYARTRLR
jgi:CheY-like chemotaxis protein